MKTLVLISTAWALLVAFLPGAYAARNQVDQLFRKNVWRLTLVAALGTWIVVFIGGCIVVGFFTLIGVVHN